MKKILLFASVVALNIAVSQSDKQLTHYMFDKMSYNPATTGMKGYCGTVIYRSQWDQFQDAPNTFLANVQGSFPDYNSGLGLSIMSDVIGLGQEMEVTLNYSYHYHIQGIGFISGGLGLGIENVSFDPKWNAPDTGGDISLDPNLPTGASATAFNMNFGLFWRGESVPYYVGLSATHLTQPTLENVSFTKARNYYVLAGYDLKGSSGLIYWMPQNLDIKPSVLFKTDMQAGIVDVNVLADYWLSNTVGVYGGVTYRPGDAVALMVGFQQRLYTQTLPGGAAGTLKAIGKPDALRFGYSYDIMTNPLNTYGKGSHELMVNYCMFAPPKPVQRYRNVFILQ